MTRRLLSRLDVLERRRREADDLARQIDAELDRLGVPEGDRDWPDLAAALAYLERRSGVPS